MKRNITVFCLLLSSYVLFGQETMNVFQTGGQILQYPVSTVDSVTFDGSYYGLMSIYQNGTIWTQIEVSFVDSITFTPNPYCDNTFQTGKLITDDTLYSGNSYSGTLMAGKIYYFDGPIYVNRGDTLTMQSGVKLLAIAPTAQIRVYGSFISLGTKNCPNWITGTSPFASPSVFKLTTPQNPNIDPALSLTIQQPWTGIQCDTSCKLLVLKWTHIEFVGNVADQTTTSLFEGAYEPGDNFVGVLFQHPYGNLIVEDCWFYGTAGDALRCKGGNISLMRNTIEKMAHDDGDAFNVQGGTVGDMVYNIFMGTGKGGTKISDASQSFGTPETVVYVYNNTYINGGWRSVSIDDGADIDYEEDASGYVYNNLIINCRTGLRVLENPPANYTFMQIGNNWTYADTISSLNNIYPPGKYIFPSTSDVPNPAIWYPGFANLPNPYVSPGVIGTVYNAATLTGIGVGQNNPMFVNYQLPITKVNGSLYTAFAEGSYIAPTNDFHLQSTSPAIGKGYTGFSAINSTNGASNYNRYPITNPYLKANVTPPNVDLGAYPTDGSGNQH